METPCQSSPRDAQHKNNSSWLRHAHTSAHTHIHTGGVIVRPGLNRWASCVCVCVCVWAGHEAQIRAIIWQRNHLLGILWELSAVLLFHIKLWCIVGAGCSTTIMLTYCTAARLAQMLNQGLRVKVQPKEEGFSTCSHSFKHLKHLLAMSYYFVNNFYWSKPTVTRKL